MFRNVYSRVYYTIWSNTIKQLIPKMAITEKYTCFFGKDSPFSQHYPCQFVVNGVTYNCAEQYMMHQKAVIFKDHDMAKKIQATNDPKEQKKYGRKVQNFVKDVWNKRCLDVVKEASMAKFSQNPELFKALKGTDGTVLVECSPRDRLWGIGLGKNNPKVKDKKNWRGKNQLGYILTEVRDTLLKDGVNFDGKNFDGKSSGKKRKDMAKESAKPKSEEKDGVILSKKESKKVIAEKSEKDKSVDKNVNCGESSVANTCSKVTSSKKDGKIKAVSKDVVKLSKGESGRTSANNVKSDTQIDKTIIPGENYNLKGEKCSGKKPEKVTAKMGEKANRIDKGGIAKNVKNVSNEKDKKFDSNDLQSKHCESIESKGVTKICASGYTSSVVHPLLDLGEIVADAVCDYSDDMDVDAPEGPSISAGPSFGKEAKMIFQAGPTIPCQVEPEEGPSSSVHPFLSNDEVAMDESAGPGVHSGSSYPVHKKNARKAPDSGEDEPSTKKLRVE